MKRALIVLLLAAIACAPAFCAKSSVAFPVYVKAAFGIDSDGFRVEEISAAATVSVVNREDTGLGIVNLYIGSNLVSDDSSTGLFVGTNVRVLQADEAADDPQSTFGLDLTAELRFSQETFAPSAVYGAVQGLGYGIEKKVSKTRRSCGATYGVKEMKMAFDGCDTEMGDFYFDLGYVFDFEDSSRSGLRLSAEWEMLENLTIGASGAASFAGGAAIDFAGAYVEFVPSELAEGFTFGAKAQYSYDGGEDHEITLSADAEVHCYEAEQNGAFLTDIYVGASAEGSVQISGSGIEVRFDSAYADSTFCLDFGLSKNHAKSQCFSIGAGYEDAMVYTFGFSSAIELLKLELNGSYGRDGLDLSTGFSTANNSFWEAAV